MIIKFRIVNCLSLAYINNTMSYFVIYMSILENNKEYIFQYTNPNKIIWIPNSFNKEYLPSSNSCKEMSIAFDPEYLTIFFAGPINNYDNKIC